LESYLLAIHPEDPLWLAIAFVSGLAFKLMGLPPLIGFLIAGFILNAVGAEASGFLLATADLGVTLLLFTIGLKLNFKSLIRPEVMGAATLHMSFVVGLMMALLTGLSSLGILHFAGLQWQTALLIAFALSFSSTVFAVKILDELGAGSTRHGQLSIGILVVQDLFAVLFLAASAGKWPSLWALALLLLFPLRHVLARLLNISGHGEMLVLFGFVVALGGADLFELVNMKGDLGALIFGMLLAGTSKANELYKTLMNFKDLFLIGFFLSVGMTAMPGGIEIATALVLMLFLPVKVALYFGVLAWFKLRTRTAWQASLNLANYSEFGLIVCAIATTSGWVPLEWMAVMAILLSFSFMLAAPLATRGDDIYERIHPGIKRFQRKQRLAGDEYITVKDVDVLIFGMGRVGSSLYLNIAHDVEHRILGVDVDANKVRQLQKGGIHMEQGDGTGPEFWSKAPGLIDQLQWIMLTMPTHEANVSAAKRIRKLGYQGKLASVAQYNDDIAELEALGVDHAFNIYAEAGAGFAEDLRGWL